MTQRTNEKVAAETPDINAERLAELRRLFPEAFAEGKLDLEKLRETLGETVESRAERYSFTWAGKRDAIRLLQMPSRATLVPCREESVNFDTTRHVFIEGDNLEVLKLLYKAYAGRVKMIYIDPPYNTGNDFVYRDHYADPLDTYLRLTGQKDENGNHTSSKTETNGRYHSAWLSMMYPRLFLARQLLREDGVIFVSIDDRELHHLLTLMHEIYGEESHIATFVWQSKKGGGGDSATVVGDHEYVVCFSRENTVMAISHASIDAQPLDKVDEKGAYRRGRELNKWGSGSRREDRPTMYFPIPGPDGVDIFPIRNDGSDGRWRWGKQKMLEIVERSDVEFEKRTDGTYIVYEKIRSDDPRTKPYRTWLTDVGTTADGTKVVKELFDTRQLYDFPKPISLLNHLITVGTTGEDDIILDFFAGCCSTAHAVVEVNQQEDGNHRFIMVQLPEPTPEDSVARNMGFQTVADIGKERIRRVIARLQQERDESLPLNRTAEDFGFRVFKLAESNFKQWTGLETNDPEEYVRQLALFADLVRPGSTDENLIAETAIKDGYGLDYRVERLDGFAENVVYRVTDPDKAQSFRICLDEAIHPSTVRALALKKDDVFICLDRALDDSAGINLSLQCRLKTL